MDETQTVLNQYGRRGNQSPLAGRDGEDPLGLSDEGAQKRSEEEMLEMFPECKQELCCLYFNLQARFEMGYIKVILSVCLHMMLQVCGANFYIFCAIEMELCTCKFDEV